MLGGADIQISAIKKAKELGYYVITCDYLPNNPGHEFSDEYHNVSTTDREAVLELAQTLGIDGISAYASDPSALTAAFVGEKLGLPGNTFHSVHTISDKYSFRNLQKELKISCPEVIQVSSAEEALMVAKKFKNGGIIKPVDTSGSKGIYVLTEKKPETLELDFVKKIFEEGMNYSRMKRIIVEEFISRKGSLMSGDFMVEKGKIIFFCFGDVHFNTRISGIVPRSISLPSTLRDPEFFAKLKNDLQLIIDKLEIKVGVFNADIIENSDGEPVIIDIGARNGGNMFNDIIHLHTGVDLIGLSMKQCLGEPVEVDYNGEIKGYYCHNVIHSEKTGILEGIDISPEFERLIFYKSISKNSGDTVDRFVNSSFRVGLVLAKFDSFEQMQGILNNIHEHVVLRVREKSESQVNN